SKTEIAGLYEFDQIVRLAVKPAFSSVRRGLSGTGLQICSRAGGELHNVPLLDCEFTTLDRGVAHTQHRLIPCRNPSCSVDPDQIRLQRTVSSEQHSCALPRFNTLDLARSVHGRVHFAGSHNLLFVTLQALELNTAARAHPLCHSFR